jgi:hypothetical protein
MAETQTPIRPTAMIQLGVPEETHDPLHDICSFRVAPIKEKL